MQAFLNLGALITLGASVYAQWGLAPALAAVSAAWLIMPYNTVGTISLR